MPHNQTQQPKLRLSFHEIYITAIEAPWSSEVPWSSGKSSSAIAKKKVAVSHEFEARLCHAATGKLSLSTQQ